MRKKFSELVHSAMSIDERIIFITADLGYKMLDNIRDSFPGRFINCGAAEQCMIGMAVGLALSGKIPICYSVTSFLLKRPFELIDLYVNGENIPVKLVGGGLFKDYGNLGVSHHSDDFLDILNLWKNIKVFVPPDENDLNRIMSDFIYNKKPSFMGLRR